jgi:hypothetical protein
VQRRPVLGPAEILLDAVQALDRDEQLVLVRVLELQVLALDVARGRLRVLRVQEPHAVEAGDAVVDVDDQLAWLVFEVQGGLPTGGPAAGPGGEPTDATEELGVRVEEEARGGVGDSGRYVQVGASKARLQLHVDAEVDLGRLKGDPGLR